ncbi:di-trans,poly-cis-decaprenylcistransferase, partial [bacterium]|nr:di-trans,poly-cis-decaprenylcistransferase [candidate division CSSED10-310 bacterium]
KRGLPRVAGHRAGVKTVDHIMEDAVALGIKVLTLYTFSEENWNRPFREVSALMELLHRNLLSKRKKLLDNDVKLRISGSIDRFPSIVRNELLETMHATDHCQTMILNLALGYSGRGEIIGAARRLAEAVAQGRLTIDDITEDSFSGALSTSGLPDPDLIIRTSGEYRLSNFLLWQASYAELFFTHCLWPDFDKDELVRAIIDYQSRDRRFGGLTSRETSL